MSTPPIRVLLAKVGLDGRLPGCRRCPQRPCRRHAARKCFVITGGSRGLGACIAQVLGEAGASVVLADIVLERAQDYAAVLTERGIDAIALPLDVGDEEQVQQVIEAVRGRFDRLDGIVNNAAIDTVIPELMVLPMRETSRTPGLSVWLEPPCGAGREGRRPAIPPQVRSPRVRLPVDHRPVAYAIALAALLVALAPRAALTPWLGTSAPYVTIYGAIALAVWFGGIDSDRRRSNDAGFDEHVVEPLDLGVLERLLG